ncbi:alkaline phosphatase D family protein [Haladaptatus caseinilyticus]|uniref:alkaline phosphatase D family protein n=1 Tax=Haladaptatus caseinilyticus TaxID=2993314 RepID=UPI00224AF8CE|nr:alkaline phosphatase D family protein [Haladaptatus caseinilyticus]
MTEPDNGNKMDAQQTTFLSTKRRDFLRNATGVAGLTTFGTTGLATAKSEEAGRFGDDPFQLGVASGDPLPDSVVLWTRLAPKPLQADGGMPDQNIEVQWKLAANKKNGKVQNVVQDGTVYARPEHAHSVHVEPEGLEPNTEYYYQFKVSTYQSPIGRTKTAQAPGSAVDELNFAFASCQNYPSGYYTSHQHLAEEDLDVAFHLGDYIYEGDAQGSLGRGYKPPHQCETLSDYRIRHAQHKTDPNLQDSHAAFPWILTWDDHEVENNYADEDDGAPPEEFLKRRAAAYQAYWEHMPLRRKRRPDGPDLPLYRRFTFGEIAEFNVLDTRQYRDDQTSSSEEAKDPERTILGDEQEQWLLDGFDSSSSKWNVLANQVPFAARDNNSDPDEVDFGGGDKWDGYRADRQTILDSMTEHPDLNPIVITGDVHRSYVYNLKSDFSDPDSQTVGTEYVGSSISSGGDSSGTTTYGDRENTPWRKFYNNNRGYVRCTLTPEECRTDYRVVSTVREPTASVNTIASFLTEAGNPGAQLITAQVDFTAPDSYDSSSGSAESFEITAAFTNPAGADAEANTMEGVNLDVSGFPDGWSVKANTATQFDTVSNGETVTTSWNVTPDDTPDGDVKLELETTYDIGSESYRHVFQEQMSEVQIAYWKFENSNEDSSSYDHTFSLRNGARYDDQAAVEGEYSLQLDGTDDYIRTSSSDFLHDAFTERTVSMWVKPDSTAGTQSIYDEGGSANGLGMRIKDDTLEAGVIDNRNLSTIENPFTRTDWVHVAVVFDTGSLTLYVDGSEVASKADVGFESVSSHGDEGEIGRSGGSSSQDVWDTTGNYFGGHIDATSIYSTALSAEKIAELSNKY